MNIRALPPALYRAGRNAIDGPGCDELYPLPDPGAPAHYKITFAIARCGDYPPRAFFSGHHGRVVDRAMAEDLATGSEPARSDVGGNKAGIRDCNAHPIIGQLDAQRVEEAGHGVLAGGVGAARGNAGFPRETRYCDDSAAR